MKCLECVPNGIKEIKEYYGDPDLDGDFIPDEIFLKNRMMRMSVPFPLKISWSETQYAGSIYGHYMVVPVIIDALQGILERIGLTEIQKRGYDEFGGVYMFRKMRGKNFLSVHSWGVAIDYMPKWGAMGSAEDAKNYPPIIKNAFLERGFDWGGNWKDPDAMHFQACTGY